MIFKFRNHYLKTTSEVFLGCPFLKIGPRIHVIAKSGKNMLQFDREMLFDEVMELIFPMHFSECLVKKNCTACVL